MAIDYHVTQMKLTLTNFRCHRSKTVEFPKTGFHLLHGKSGSGKTSILNAILYVLYGNIKRPYTHGTKTCSVVLETETMVITRSSRPNKLTLVYNDGSYEEEAAQTLINNIYGTEGGFLSSSYIKQRNTNSIISLTPSEQVAYLKNIALQGTDSTEYKSKAKLLVKRKKTELDRIEGEISVLEKQVQNADFDTETPLVKPKKTMSSLKKSLKSYQKKLNKLNNDISELNSKIESIQEIENSQKLRLDIEKRIQIHKETLSNLCPEQEHESYESIVAELDKLEQTNKHHIYQALKKEIKDYFLEIEEGIPKDLDKLKKEYDTLCENQKYSSVIEEKKKSKTIFNRIRSEIHSNKEFTTKSKTFNGIYNYLTKLIDSYVDYVCPSCDTNLRLVEDKLCSVSSDAQPIPEETRKIVNEYIEQLTEIRPTYTMKIPKKIGKVDEKRLKELQTIITEAEKSLNILENSILPSYLQKKKDTVHRGTNMHKDMKNDEVVEKLNEMRKKLAVVSNIEDEKHRINKEISKLKCEMDELPEPPAVKLTSMKTLSSTMSKKTKEMKTCSDNIQSIQQDIQNLNEYESRLKKQQEYKKLLESLDERKNMRREKNNQLEGAQTLERLTKDAEVVMLQNTINSINTFAKVYLDQMFEDVICVELRNIKTVKSTMASKMQLNTFISYKGNEYTNVSELSGGEKQRVELAFLLAVNDMLNSGILLLDECLNNLDTEINSSVLKHLKEISKESKLVLVVSHEAVQGNFDSIITF